MYIRNHGDGIAIFFVESNYCEEQWRVKESCIIPFHSYVLASCGLGDY